MRQVPPGLAAHLERKVTTLARAWRLTRRDGAVRGFTDHDRSLDFAGTRFAAGSGLGSGSARAELGLSASNREVTGALSSDGIAEADIEAGLFDGARVECFVVDWDNPADHMLLDIRTIGEVTRGETGFTAELRGIEVDLDRPRGRLYRRRCDVVFGDARCGVNAQAAPFRFEVTVTEAVAGALHVSGVPTAARLIEGRVRMLTGAAAGSEAEILGESHGRETVRLAVEEGISTRAVPGDRALVTVGCDRSFQTCRDRFANTGNFRGFPHMPGSDSGLAVAKEGDAHDGSPLVP